MNRGHVDSRRQPQRRLDILGIEILQLLLGNNRLHTAVSIGPVTFDDRMVHHINGIERRDPLFCFLGHGRRNDKATDDYAEHD